MDSTRVRLIRVMDLLAERSLERTWAVEKEVFPGVLMGGGPVLPGGQQAAGQIHHRTEEERQVDKKKEQVGAQALLRNGQGVGPVHPRGQGDEEKADEGLDQEKGQQREKAPPLKTP